MTFGQTDNYGTDFWTGFMQNFGTPTLKLYISARQNSKVTISVPLKSYTTSITIPKDSVAEVVIPTSVAATTSSQTIDQTGVHIESDYPVSVAAMNLQAATTDATIVLPTKNIPTNPVYVTAHPGKSGFSGLATNEFMLISPENGVSVEIVPTAGTNGGSPAGVPIYITLDQGQTYQVISSRLLDGSRIRVLNGKKLVVLTGDRCSNFPCTACDHQVEQVFPNQLLDTAYYTIPQWGHGNGYVVKVISVDTLLSVKVNGKFYTIPRRDSALVFDVPREDSVLHISASRKFSVFEFMKGTTCNGYISTRGFGDPSILQLLSTRYMGQRSTFSTVTSASLSRGDHFVTILIPTIARNDVYLDASKVNPSDFIVIPDNRDLAYAKIKLTQGTHSISCKFGHLAYCYGVSNAESYFYVAGFSLPNFDISMVDSVLSYNCKDGLVTMQFKAKLEGSVKSYLWDFGDGSSKGTTEVVTHSYPVNKTFTIKLWAEGFNGKTDSIVKKYDIRWPEFNPVFDKVLCDSIYRFEEQNPYFKNFRWHDNSTNAWFDAGKTGKIWVTATDTSGYCKFSDTANIVKIDVMTKVLVDTLSHCHLNNLFRFRDSSVVKNDAIAYKVWSFPQGFYKYDTTDFLYHFRQPGKLMVYLDIYPVKANCKARFEIPVTVDWNTDIDGYTNKEKYCNGEMAVLRDSSYACCQKVKKYYWEFEDGSKVNSDSGILRTRVYFNTKTQNQILKYNYITENIRGCRDTLKYGVLVWPPAKSNFDLGVDTAKCLVLSRWTFTHTYDNSMSGDYNVLWNFGNGKTGTQYQYRNFRYTDTGVFAVKLTTTSQFGCLDSTIKNVRVLPQPRVKFSFADSTVCLNDSVRINNQSEGSLLTYTWKYGNGKGSGLKTPVPYSYSATGKFRVSLAIGSPNPGCLDSAFRIIEVLKNPQAILDLVTDSLCLDGNQLTPGHKSLFYNGKKAIYWSAANGYSDSTDTPKPLTFSQPGWQTIRLKVVDQEGCTDTTSGSVFLQSTARAVFTVNDSIQCLASNRFLINAQTDPLISTMRWNLAGSAAGTTPVLDIRDLKPEGRYKVQLNVFTTKGCKDSTWSYIEVLPAPQPGFTVNRDTQCFSTQRFDLKNTATAPGDIIRSWIYRNGATLVSGLSDPAGIQFPSKGSYTLKQTIVTNEGCTDSAKNTVFVAQDPMATFKSDSVCLGELITMTAIQIAGDFPVTAWQWALGNGNRQNSNPVTVLYSNAGNYVPVLSWSDRLGCAGVMTGSPNVIYPLPTAGFSSEVLNSDKDYTYVRLDADEPGNARFRWTLPNGSVYDNDPATLSLPRFFKDRIWLLVTNAYGCTDTASQMVYVFPPLNGIWVENAFTPNNDQLNDVFKPLHFEGAEKYTLRIFDRWGEKMFETTDPNMGWDGRFRGADVQTGAYIYTVEFIYADGMRYSLKGTVTVVR